MYKPNDVGQLIVVNDELGHEMTYKYMNNFNCSFQYTCTSILKFQLNSYKAVSVLLC